MKNNTTFIPNEFTENFDNIGASIEAIAIAWFGGNPEAVINSVMNGNDITWETLDENETEWELVDDEDDDEVTIYRI